MVLRVVPVGLAHHSFGATKHTGHIINRDTALQQPSRACVPQNVRRHVFTKASKLARAAPCATFLRGDGQTIPFDQETRGMPTPAAHVRQQPRRNGQWRLTLAGLDGSPRTAVDHAVIEIDMTAGRVCNPLQPQDRVMAGAGIEADQDEAGKVPIDPVMMPPAVFVPSERTSKQACGFRPCKMTLAWLRLQG